MTFTSTTTTTFMDDDIMTLSSFSTISAHSPELQLCINDLVHPTEVAETLLETLSNEQLNIIEQAVTKIKERKLNHPQLKDGVNIPTPVLSAVTTLTPNSPVDPPSSVKEDWSVETQVAKALADVISPTTNKSISQLNNNKPLSKSSPAKPQSPFLSSHEPTTELREGVEWVSFVYSHHRTLKRYCIRTDLDKVDSSILDPKFKNENCVYPRANLPRETYRGNRWAYETECNELGWKLAYLNLEEIAGKRGLIQRAVDSYRNRYPSMRSRRVARQEKLLKGTLRKRKHRDGDDCTQPQQQQQQQQQKLKESEKAPKTILIEETPNTKCRIRINIESVCMETMDIAFKKNNCVFPRAMNITADTPNVSQRRLDESKCNEIGWKLAWLNPRQLANKKNLLQRALDTYRNQFTIDLKPRKYASRSPPDFKPQVETKPLPLTEQTLAEQQKEYQSTTPSNKRIRRDSGQSCYSGTTVTLDFHDYCFSPPAEEEVVDTTQLTSFTGDMFNDIIMAGLPITIDDVLSEGSSSNNTHSYQNTPSPEALMTFYQQALLSNNPEGDHGVDFMTKYQSVVNAGISDLTTDPTLLNQLF